MSIRRKSTLDKKYFESIGQGALFGYDNLHFKTVNLPKKQRLTNLCKRFNVKLINQTNPVFLKVIRIF